MQGEKIYNENIERCGGRRGIKRERESGAWEVVEQKGESESERGGKEGERKKEREGGRGYIGERKKEGEKKRENEQKRERARNIER